MAMARNSSAENKQITAYSKCGKRGWMQIFYARVLSLLDDVNKNTTVHYTPRQIYRRQTRVKKKADGREGRYQKLHLETLLFYFTPQEHKRMTQRADMLVGSDEQMNWVGGDSTLTLGGLVYTPAMRCGLYCPAAGKPVWSSYQPNHTYFSCPVIINQGERYHRAVLPHPNWHHVVQIPTGAHLFLGTLLTLIILLFDLSPPPPPLPNEKFPP